MTKKSRFAKSLGAVKVYVLRKWLKKHVTFD